MHSIPLHNRIGLKVFFAFLIAIVPLIGVIASLNYGITLDAMDHARNLVCRAVFEAAAEQDAQVTQVREMLRQLAAQTEIRALNARAATPVLRRALGEKSCLTNLFLCDAAGRVLASAKPGYVGRDVSRRQYVRDALAKGGIAHGRYVISAVTSRPALHFSCPTKAPDETPTGVLVAALDLTRYGGVFARLGLPRGGFLELLDGKGVRLWRTPPEKAAPVGRSPDPALVAKVLGPKRAGYLVETGLETGAVLVAYRQLAAADDAHGRYGVMLVGLPAATAMADARSKLAVSVAISAGSVGAAILVAVLLGRVVIVRRLGVLADLVTDVEQNRVCLLPRDFGSDEIGILGRRFVDLSQELHEKNGKLAEAMDQLRREKTNLEAVVGQLGQAQEELVRRANFDALTGLRNRRSFNERLRGEFARWRRYGTPLTLVLLDIDDFKHVNDTYGHGAGDEVLRAVADRVRHCLRATDEPYRVGGEEFALILSQTRAEDGLAVAERVRATMAGRPIPLSDGGQVRLTVSLGLAEVRDGVPAQKDLYTAADKALYRAKALGKNRVVHAPPPGEG